MGATTTDPPVLMHCAEGVALITINRPAVRNAMNRSAAERLAAALDELDARTDVRAGILTGANGSFSAGMDLKALSQTGERPFTASRGAFGIVQDPPHTPLIAAVEGPALGGGFEIALSCDMIVAAESAIFGLPEAKRGLVAAAGGLLRLAHRLPRNLALELVATGEPISARRAFEVGLVNHVVADGRAVQSAHDLAARIAANAPLAVATSKKLVDLAPQWTIAEGFESQQELVAAVRSSEDAKEGARAFVQKRAPVWSGR